MDKKADIECIFCGINDVWLHKMKNKARYKERLVEYTTVVYLCKNCGEIFSDISMIQKDLNKIKRAYKKAPSGKS